MIAQKSIEELKYPIGKFSFPKSFTENDIKSWSEVISIFPSLLRKEVEQLTEAELDTPYREGGWTGRQVVHHVADSHMNAYIRFKLALTEDNPTIKPYLEKLWAELPEAKNAPAGLSLDLINALHKRWTIMLNNMQFTDFKRTFFHPEQNASRSLGEFLALYAWHSKHHLAHVASLKQRA